MSLTLKVWNAFLQPSSSLVLTYIAFKSMQKQTLARLLSQSQMKELVETK